MTAGIAIISCVCYALLMVSPWNTYWVTSLGKLLVFGVVPLGYLLTKGDRFGAVFHLGDKKSLKLPLLLGVGCCLVIWVGYTLLYSFFDSQQILSGLKAQGITKVQYPFVFLHIVLINSFLEEFFFRGFLFRQSFLKGNKRFAYLFSSILFAFYHISIFNSWFSPAMVAFCIVGLVVAGLFFCEVDRRCDNIYGGWLLHVGANLGINVIGAWLFLTA
ncbi:MAG: CPBP family intramembrane metalloprotease [Clostridia bacterium]|nr:CPBP family intramembrane metalloprotease [Clostridia bacterium]